MPTTTMTPSAIAVHWSETHRASRLAGSPRLSISSRGETSVKMPMIGSARNASTSPVAIPMNAGNQRPAVMFPWRGAEPGLAQRRPSRAAEQPVDEGLRLHGCLAPFTTAAA